MARIKEIPLTQGKYALVDAEWFYKLADKRWSYSRGYARHGELSMHRVIMNPPDGYIIDHVDGNPLNNTMINLRVCTPSENARNQKIHNSKRKKSIYKGVTLHSTKSRWAAYIRVDKKLLHLGLYKSEVAAAKAYNKAAKIHHGEFARLNRIRRKKVELAPVHQEKNSEPHSYEI